MTRSSFLGGGAGDLNIFTFSQASHLRKYHHINSSGNNVSKQSAMQQATEPGNPNRRQTQNFDFQLAIQPMPHHANAELTMTARRPYIRMQTYSQEIGT
jgi:hypothetical protein